MSDVAENLSDAQRQRLVALLANPKYELIPLSNISEQIDYLPGAATVTVTASPAKGMAATMTLATELAERGFRVVPHLSARLTQDRDELARILDEAGRAGLTEAFVVGGDAKDPGTFFDGLALLEAMQDLGHPFSRIGIPGYPEGHPTISQSRLQQAIRDKAPYATSMTSQMCFDETAVLDWLRSQRAANITLPVELGIPGVGALRKLAGIAARIGVGDSSRFLTSNTRLIGKLVRPGGYAPDELLVALGPAYVEPGINIAGLHIFTFNQIETTERWRRDFLARLG